MRYSLVDHAMGDNNRLVIAARGEQWIPQMEGDTADGIAMQSHCLIRFRGQIQVEPEHLLVVGGDQQIVALWMYGHARYPLGVGQ